MIFKEYTNNISILINISILLSLKLVKKLVICELIYLLNKTNILMYALYLTRKENASSAK